MAITITNTLALGAIHALARNQSAVQTSLQRLATGFRINTAKDDPAGLIASELLRSDMATTAAEIANAQRADLVLATADGALTEVSNLLVSLQGLVVASANSAGLSSDELDANQLQVDSILSTLGRISNTTTFSGQKLLDGQLGYHISAGPNFSAFENLKLYSAPPSLTPATIHLQVLTSAQHAALIFHGSVSGLASAVSLSVAGAAGTVQLSFASSTSAAVIASAINQNASLTGVTASASANDITFLTAGFGARQFVAVTSNSAAFQTQTVAGAAATRATGRDATVALNGQPIRADGLAVTVNDNGLSASFLLNPLDNTTGNSAAFTLTGGGATFALTGLTSSDATSLGIDPITPAALGYVRQGLNTFSLAELASSGNANLRSGHLDVAQQIVSGAIQQVASQRGRIGAVRKYDIQSTINSLSVRMENLSSAESAIRDTDFAAETASLARNQILAAASQSALAAALQNQQLILKLLGA
jgi:flagellin